MEWRHVGGTRNFSVVLNLTWRRSDERGGRGNVAEREICHLLKSSCVCAWNYPGINQLQGRKGTQTRALCSPHREGRSLVAKGGADFNRENTTSCIKVTRGHSSSTSSSSGKLPCPSIHPGVRQRSWLSLCQEKEANALLWGGIVFKTPLISYIVSGVMGF